MFNIVVAAILVLAALAFVAAPLRRRAPAKGGKRPAELADLEKEKRRLLELIRDIEFDRQVGKVLEDDYRSSLARYKTEAVDVMKRIDALMPRRSVESVVDEEISRIRDSLRKASGA